MVSVAIATYNGEKYIYDQIRTVLDNLNSEDEVIISDDNSNDKTIDIIKSFKDSRVKIYDGPQKGIVENFANAISKCKGDIIFLCDQDDIWYPNKVKHVCDVFESTDCILVEHDARVVDEKKNVLYESFFEHRNVRAGFWKNYMRNTYHGCLMAFRRELVQYLNPFPKKGCLHDQWIGLVAERKGKIVFLPEILMEYKRHSGNASSFKRLPFARQLGDRLNLLIYIIKRKIW